MIVAVTATGPTLDHTVEPRFGRCPYFLIINSETLAFEALQNPNAALGGGAGPQSAQLMHSQGVKVVLTGNCGPNAFQTFGAAGIEVITGVAGTVRDAVAQYRMGKLQSSSAPNVKSHFGTGRRSGRGMGMGRGMGKGMGYELEPAAEPNLTQPRQQIAPAPDIARGQDEEAVRLREQVKQLRSQVESLQHQIDSFAASDKK